MTNNERQRKVEWILSYLRRRKNVIIDKDNFIAIATLELSTTERTIKEIIDTLEKTKKIDVRMWKWENIWEEDPQDRTIIKGDMKIQEEMDLWNMK